MLTSNWHALLGVIILDSGLSVGGGSVAFLRFQILWRTEGAETLSEVFIQEGLLQTISRRMP